MLLEKNKRGLELVSLPHLNRPNFTSRMSLLRQVVGSSYNYCNCLLTSLQRNKFGNQPYLSNQDVFPHAQKIKSKI